MRVMVLVKATANSEKGLLPGEALATAMGKYNDALIKAGVLLAGEGLKPTSTARRVSFSRDSSQHVVDGPFPGTPSEHVAGFWLWQVKSMDEALEWARRCPHPMPDEEAVLELRPVFEASDFEPARVGT